VTCTGHKQHKYINISNTTQIKTNINKWVLSAKSLAEYRKIYRITVHTVLVSRKLVIKI